MRVLDLFCGAGGAAMGMHRACFTTEILGIDTIRQPRYPFRFEQMDWRDGLVKHGDWADFIWASPVCKRYTRMTNCRPGLAETHPDSISELRECLVASGKPYVIENVPGAPLQTPILLCGIMFNLPLYRHRLFESSFKLGAPDHFPHLREASRAGHWKPGTIMSVAGHFSPMSEGQRAMGIDWMTRDEMSQAIPPAYSEYVMRLYKIVHLDYSA